MDIFYGGTYKKGSEEQNLRIEIHKLLGSKTKHILSNTQTKLQLFSENEKKNILECIDDIIKADESNKEENFKKYKK